MPGTSGERAASERRPLPLLTLRSEARLESRRRCPSHRGEVLETEARPGKADGAVFASAASSGEASCGSEAECDGVDGGSSICTVFARRSGAAPRSAEGGASADTSASSERPSKRDGSARSATAMAGAGGGAVAPGHSAAASAARDAPDRRAIRGPPALPNLPIEPVKLRSREPSTVHTVIPGLGLQLCAFGGLTRRRAASRLTGDDSTAFLCVPSRRTRRA